MRDTMSAFAASTSSTDSAAKPGSAEENVFADGEEVSIDALCKTMRHSSVSVLARPPRMKVKGQGYRHRLRFRSCSTKPSFPVATPSDRAGGVWETRFVRAGRSHTA